MPPAITSHAVEQPGQITRSITIPGEYIVTLKPEFIGEPEAGDQKLSNASLEKQQQNIFIAAAGAEELIEDQGANVTQIYDRVLNGFALEGVQDVTPLIQDPAIDSVEPNFSVFPQTQYFPTAEDRLDLDRAVTVSSRPDNRESRPNIDVAIVDQPVASQHPDLVVVGRVNLIDGCGSKIVPPGYPAAGAVMTCYNENGYHGTHVAGSIAARDNLGGIVGGIPGARIHSWAVCSVNAGCANSDTLQAWNAIIANGQIEIANESVGSCGSELTSTDQTAGQNLINAGVTMFTSAGNCNRSAPNSPYCGITAFICVSAMADFDGKCGGQSSLTTPSAGGTVNRDDQRAAFSNHGTDVDIMAPGVEVLSTYPGSTTLGDPSTAPTGWGTGTGVASYIGTSEHGKYETISGTSMASPIAAGIGGLVKSKNPTWTPAQIKADLLAKAYPQNQPCDGNGKGGLVAGANSESSEKILYAGSY